MENTSVNENSSDFYPVPGYPGLMVNREGQVHGKKKILKPIKDKSGYLYILSYKGSLTTQPPVHRLVAMTFLPTPDGKDFKFWSVDHIDRNKENNAVSNLRWMSFRDNALMYNNPLSDAEAIEAYNLFQSGMSVVDIAKKYNKSYAAIHGIVKGRSYKHLRMDSAWKRQVTVYHKCPHCSGGYIPHKITINKGEEYEQYPDNKISKKRRRG